MKTLSILAVDDHEEICALLAENLGRAGHRVTCAHDGRKAADCLADREFDLVITDIIMPEMDGLELMAEVKKRQPAAHLLAMSCGTRYLSQGDCLNLAASLGAHAILPKPFNKKELMQAVDHAFGQQDGWLDSEDSSPAAS